MIECIDKETIIVDFIFSLGKIVCTCVSITLKIPITVWLCFEESVVDGMSLM